MANIDEFIFYKLELTLGGTPPTTGLPDLTRIHMTSVGRFALKSNPEFEIDENLYRLWHH